MYSVFIHMYQVDTMAGYLCILVRWIIYHMDTLSFLFLEATFHLRLISSSNFGVFCHLYLRGQLFAFACHLIRVVLFESTQADYSILYLIIFYFNGSSSNQQLFLIVFAASCFSGVLHVHPLFLFSGTFSSLEASSVLEQPSSLFGLEFFPMRFSLFLCFTEIFCTWVPHQTQLSGPIVTFMHFV